MLAHLLPEGATSDARLLLTARTLRGFADGFVSVLLVSYLSGIGFSSLEIGALVTATLLGSAALTLGVGLAGARLPRRRLLMLASVLMALTGIGFSAVTDFWPLLLVGIAGTLNPSAGDVTVFLPTEQALLPDTVDERGRTALFARFNLAARFAGAVGALATAGPVLVAEAQGWDVTDAQRAGFVLYAAIAVAVGLVYAKLSPDIEPVRSDVRSRPLERSRGIVLRLSALFSLDSAGSGLVLDSLLALYLFNRFGLEIETVAAIFFAAGLLAAFSQLASSWLAERIGLINTMVYTHLPANAFLAAAAFMPNAELAVGLLLARMALSQMDVPARQSYVSAVVPREERSAAAAVTNVPRALAAATTPLLAGFLLSQSDFGWPLLIAGIVKAGYDLLLLALFSSHPPTVEAGEMTSGA